MTDASIPDQRSDVTVQSMRTPELGVRRKIRRGQRKRTLEIGSTLKRGRKGDQSKRRYPWAIVRDVITADPAPDTSEYVDVLCEGLEELKGQWFVWRAYFTNNRNCNLHFGQYGPQAPMATDKWISEEIVRRGWHKRISVVGESQKESVRSEDADTEQGD